MKILLLSPADEELYLKHSRKEAKYFWFARLSLTMLAALTPSDIEVYLVDENIEKINFNLPVDLVGISVMTSHAPRAYRIAGEFRKRGVKVVLGGIHPTAMPQEAALQADAVVIGEAEQIWGTLLDDFKAGKLKKFYQAAQEADLVNLPHPRRELLKKDAYNLPSTVQTSRGCPFSCEFCSVSDFFGRKYRLRPIEDVIQEVKLIDDDFIAFVDDNITGNHRHAKELFKRLIPLKIKWGGQTSLTMARDKELMRLAAESGCVGMFVGIESLSAENLKAMKKGFNKVEQYEEAIKTFHDHGITVTASIVFGFDNDDEGVFERTVTFLEKNKIELATFYILTPLPGTVWAKKLAAEKRIIEKDWAKYNGGYVVFKPRLMSVETLQEGYLWAFHHFYSLPSIIRRLLLFPQKRLRDNLLLNYGLKSLIKTMPGGTLSPFSKVINKLQPTIPSLRTSTEGLIPQVMEVVKQKTGEAVKKVDYFLKIKVRKNEQLNFLQLELEGILDKATARKLRKRIIQTLSKVHLDIILNFEKISYISPQALKILFGKQMRRNVRKEGIKVKLLNISNQIKEFIEESSFYPYSFEICQNLPRKSIISDEQRKAL